MLIRPEVESDHAAVRAVNMEAFETAAESKLVDQLRERVSTFISLVAEEDESIVGHIFFSPVRMPERDDVNMMGLAPMAIRPEFQRKGIGSALVTRGIDECLQIGCEAVVVLGHPQFYSRFGFQSASRFQITSEYDVPDEYFMAKEIVPDALKGVSGVVKYHEAFGGI